MGPNRFAVPVEIIRELGPQRFEYSEMCQHQDGEYRHGKKEENIFPQITGVAVCEHIAKNDQSQLNDADDQQGDRERTQVVVFDDQM